MSRVINTSLATIQFQVNARQANAAMQALQEASNDLNRAIDSVNRNIANLGKDVHKDNPQLLNYQNQLAGLKKDLKDVEKAQRDFLKGAKAADQLWKAAQEGNIESLSFRSIEAGMSGLKKRQKGLRPESAQDMQDWRIIKQVIDEADRVIKEAGADVQHVVQTLREGGKVSEQAMRQTINTLKELKGSVDETDADFRTWGNDLDFMEGKLKDFNEAQRRARGEIVNANDARREMDKLTEEGAAAAKRNAEAAEQLVASLKQESEELVRKRGEIKQNIEDTQKQIDENHKLIEEKHRQLAADEETFNAEQQGRRTTIEGLKQQAEAERKLADDKSDAAETHRRAAELQAQTTQQLTEKVTELQGKLAELNAEQVKPKVDASELEKIERKLKNIDNLRKQQQEVIDAYEAKYGKTSDEQYDAQDKVRAEAVRKDVAAREAAVDKVNNKWEEFWKKQEAAAQEFARSLGKSLDDIIPEEITSEHLSGPLAKSAQAAYKVTAQREYELGVALFGEGKLNQDREFARRYEGDDSPEAKVIESLQRKYREYTKELREANAVDTESKKIREEQRKESEAYYSALGKMQGFQKVENDLLQQKEALLKQSTTATKSEAEALKELEDAQKKLTERKDWLSRQEGYLKENLDVLKQIGLKEEDLADEGKVREAVEKKVLEIMQAQANVEKEVAEQQQKMIAGLKDNALGGTKADRDYYLKNKGFYNLEDYATPDDVMERIAHLEKVGKLKNGKKFSDDTYWDPDDDDLDDDDAIIMNDKEREYIKNELRVLKQHVREQIIKAIREAGDIDKGVENATGGDGVSEDARFGEEINDKIEALKDKIHESIKTTVESYSDLLGEDIDREIPMTNEELTSRIKGIVSYTGESLASDRENIGWAKEDVQDAEALVAAKQKQVDAIKAGTQATAESNEKTEEELRLKGELETTQGKLAESKKRENEEQQEYVKLQGEAIEQGNKAAAAETKLADAQSEATQKQAEFNQKQQEGLDNINQMAQGNQALQQSIDGLNGELEQNSKDIADNANKATEAEQQKQQARQLSIKRMEEMLAKLKEEYYTEELTAEKREEHIRDIQKLEKAISTEKAKPMLDMMTQRMQDVGSLSKSALEETRKFWEAMAQGADKGSEKLATAEAHIKALVEEERKRSEAQAGKVIGDMGSYSDKEIADAVKTFEQLRDAQTHGNDEWRKFNELAEQGKQHLEEMAKTDALTKMEANMSNLATLSDAARAETKKFFETLKAGAEKGSEDLTKAETHLKAIKDLEKGENEAKARNLLTGTLSNYSESEIREYIDAAQAFRKELASGDPAAQSYADAIAKAEAHVKKYGVEAARAAQQQADSNKLMQDQLNRIISDKQFGIAMPTASQLKAQKQYWQRLIDDPKTAASSLQQFRDRLAEVEQLEKEMVEINGKTALQWFGDDKDKDASGNQIKEMADKLKEYRGTLLKETNADEIAQIDAILQRIGASAKKATEELMDFEKAKELALQAGDDVYGKNNPAFLASPEEIQAATKSIEKYREELFKTIKQKKDMGKATDAEEAELQELAKYLKDLKFEQDNFNMSREKMEELMRTPTNAVSLDELRSAIKRADGELKRMEGSLGENSKQYQEFAAQVKNAKNVLKDMEGQAKATSSAFEKAWQRLKTYVTFYVSAAAAIQKIIGTFGDLMELSDKMGEVQKTTGFTADEVGRLSDSLKKLDTRTAITGLLDLSVAAGQLGLKTQEDVEGFTIAANKLMVALPEMGKEGATEMLKVALATGEIDKIRRQMEEGLIDGSSATAVAMEKVGSTIDRLRATSAATAPAITDFVKRVGAVGAQSGITIDQVAALGSTVDALGMRVEMSATALSRMIPAIKNNAYQIGALIGQTEESIISRFENGMGMDVILDIFQSIRDNSQLTTGNVEADAEAIEQAFEGAGLKEVMKELNQMGARAGIVFAGLSQNVDELRRQLGVAAEAYEENIAIEAEYQKMNDTTAAKWERLKNQLEETFVGDRSQRVLGGLIDGLRKIVDFINGDVNPALKTLRVVLLSFIAAWATFKAGLGEMLFASSIKGLKNLKDSIIRLGTETKEYIALKWKLVMAHDAETKAATRAKLANNALNKSLNSNVWMALVAAIFTAVMALKNWLSELDTAEKKMADINSQIDHEKDKLRDLHVAYISANKDLDKRKNILNEINRKYSNYLGFLLTDAENSNLVALAHERIAAAMEKEALQRERNQAASNIRQQYREELSEDWESFTKGLRNAGLNSVEIAEARNDIMEFLQQLNYDQATGNIQIPARVEGELKRYLQNVHGVANTDISDASIEATVAMWVNKYLEEKFPQMNQNLLGSITGVRIGRTLTGGGWERVTGIDNFRGDYAKTYMQMLQQIGKLTNDLDGQIAVAEGKRVKSTEEFITNLKHQAESAISVITNVNSTEDEIAEAYEHLASAIEGLSENTELLNNSTEQADRTTATELNNYVEQLQTTQSPTRNLVDWSKVGTIRERQQQVEEQARLANSPNATVDNGNGHNNIRGPYGDFDKRMDPYEQWSADALVKRREEMLMRVQQLAGGADVQAVLSMDKRFMDEATRKGIHDMRDAIEWYNTERMKIQEELHERHLTNEGMWMDPKQSRSKKPKQVYSEEAIAELDRYYAWRKEELERQRAEEGTSEAEFNRRMEAMEQEHLQKRADLRTSFTTKDKQFVQQFRQWWENVAELDTIEWQLIEAEWIAALDRDRKYNDRNAQKDLQAMRAITVKQLHAIEEIIDKERPFNGITRNMEENLTNMGILFADLDEMRKKALEAGQSTTDIDAMYVTEEPRRLAWLLGQAEDAYTLTVEEMMRRMAEDGMQAWADELNSNENGDEMKRALLAQLHTSYDAVQEAIKKEASQIKKQTDIWWADIAQGQDTSRKGGFEKMLSQLGLVEDQVKRANSLIGAGAASERVADRLAIRQMQIRLSMQETYYNRMRQIGQQRIDDLKEQARAARERGDMEEAARKEADAEHVARSLNLALSEEQKKLDEQRVAIANQLEESQNRLYTALRGWGDLLASSVRDVFEAAHAGEEEYYNSLATYRLTGKGGPGAGMYVVIEDAGTSDAEAHYEYLSEIEAIERQREIERQNAQAEAWKKVMDDLNAKMSEQITDSLNAMLQNQAVNENTAELRSMQAMMDSDIVATNANINALDRLTAQLAQGINVNNGETSDNGQPSNNGQPSSNNELNGLHELGNRELNGLHELDNRYGAPWMQQQSEQQQGWQAPLAPTATEDTAMYGAPWAAMAEASDAATNTIIENDKKAVKSSSSTFAKMSYAANMYGIAYQTMSNDNLSATQKFTSMALQAVGNYAINALTMEMANASAKAATDSPGVLGTLWKQLGWGAAPVFAIFTGLLGGLMGLVSSKITKAKAQIAQATGASASAGKLATGMLTYAEGNVNELTDPASLTPGQSYNVDAADGRTYRAKYMGVGAKTHITNGPEFHLVGEKGREAIIDAHTTRHIQLNEPEIWGAIKTLYNGGALSTQSRRRTRRGVRSFADGNIEDFEDVLGGSATETGATGGFTAEQAAAFQSSLDRNNELLERALSEGIKGVFNVYGRDGLVDSYDRGKKNLNRHGEKY